MKLIYKADNGNRVYYNYEWSEYVLKPQGVLNSDCWYHTDCQQDAIDTATRDHVILHDGEILRLTNERSKVI